MIDFLKKKKEEFLAMRQARLTKQVSSTQDKNKKLEEELKIRTEFANERKRKAELEAKIKGTVPESRFKKALVSGAKSVAQNLKANQERAKTKSPFLTDSNNTKIEKSLEKKKSVFER